ncbi:hypothetical protein BHM03_00000700 [Ensete ventricosum]|nr:hypothetical protein BHM03_00000700 [Ensete ventricosum]
MGCVRSLGDMKGTTYSCGPSPLHLTGPRGAPTARPQSPSMLITHHNSPGPDPTLRHVTASPSASFLSWKTGCKARKRWTTTTTTTTNATTTHGCAVLSEYWSRGDGAVPCEEGGWSQPVGVPARVSCGGPELLFLCSDRVLAVWEGRCSQ